MIRPDSLKNVPKIPVELVGHDGNAFAIMGSCAKAVRRAGSWEPSWWTEIRGMMMQGTYSDLLAVVEEFFEVS